MLSLALRSFALQQPFRLMVPLSLRKDCKVSMCTKTHMYFCAGSCIHLYVHGAFVHSCYQTGQPHVKMSEMLMLRQHLSRKKRKCRKRCKGFLQPHSNSRHWVWIRDCTADSWKKEKIEVFCLVSYIAAENIGEWKRQGAIKALKIQLILLAL